MVITVLMVNRKLKFPRFSWYMYLPPTFLYYIMSQDGYHDDIMSCTIIQFLVLRHTYEY